jgi:hypothetical protein
MTDGLCFLLFLAGKRRACEMERMRDMTGRDQYLGGTLWFGSHGGVATKAGRQLSEVLRTGTRSNSTHTHTHTHTAEEPHGWKDGRKPTETPRMGVIAAPHQAFGSAHRPPSAQRGGHWRCYGAGGSKPKGIHSHVRAYTFAHARPKHERHHSAVPPREPGSRRSCCLVSEQAGQAEIEVRCRASAGVRGLWASPATGTGPWICGPALEAAPALAPANAAATCVRRSRRAMHNRRRLLVATRKAVLLSRAWDAEEHQRKSPRAGRTWA